MTDQKKLPGVTLVAVLLFIYSLCQLTMIFGFERYQFVFQFLPEGTVKIRFVGSIILRVLTILTAVGILFYKDIFRKTLLYISAYNMIVVYWKHPYQAFVNWDRYYQLNPEKINDMIYQITGSMVIDYPTIKWISVAAACLSDLIFFGAIIYYFTRPSVKQKFT